MHIRRLRIQNYKSFNDSGWIDFSGNFNVVVGKNSSGKTALIEAFRLNGTTTNPHRSLARRPDEALNPNSMFLAEASFSENELRDALLSNRSSIEFPIPSQLKDMEICRRFIDEYFASKTAVLNLRALAQHQIEAASYPWHGLFENSAQPKFVQVIPTTDNQSYDMPTVFTGGEGAFPQFVRALWSRKVFVFRAERLALGACSFGEDKVLSADAGNLPRVLFTLSTNPSQFDRFNRHVNQIFPYIKRVVVFAHGTDLDIRLWYVDLSTERGDLAIPLKESGTGVGQALAILYVAMTINSGVIVIDEPNSFLHPGAAKTLIEILSQYNHQYIVSTHSPEIIAAANPNTLLVVHWNDGASKIEPIDRTNFIQLRQVLSGLGVSASDILGADEIIWVEGQTEEDCFPIVLQYATGDIPSGMAFKAVRSVDEIIRKSGSEDLVLDIYQRLSSIAAFIPKALRFSFDRENRSEEYLHKVETKHNKQIRFLPARCYECFLIHPTAISILLTQEAVALGGNQISESAVTDWLSNNAANFNASTKWTGTFEYAAWRTSVDAPKLLDGMFQSFLKIEYRKAKHSRILTAWLLENDPEFVKPLTEYVLSLVRP